MTRALVIGNGESRAWFHPDDWCLPTNMEAWGCNAIYRDGSVDHLVSVDYVDTYISINSHGIMDFHRNDGRGKL